MKNAGILRMELRRAFTSPGFFAAVVGMAAVLFVGTASEMNTLGGMGSVYYFFLCANSFNSITDIMLVVSVLPFATSFCADFKNHYYRPILARTSADGYSSSKAAACFISTFAAVALGCILFVLALSLFYPFLDEIAATSLDPFSELPIEKYAVLHLLFFILIRSLAAAFWGELSLMSTAFMPSVFAALCMPLIAYNLLSLLTDVFDASFNISMLQQSSVTLGPWYFTLIYSCLLFILLAVLCAVVFKKQVRRLVKNA